MPSYPLLQIDAFTGVPLEGNSCAVVFDADPLDTETMQAVAREMNLSETAFVLRSERADFRARYFTPAQEIPMAGHPTVATVFGLAETGRLKLMDEHTRISLELNVGPIDVDLESRDGVVHQVVMAQKPPQFGRELERGAIAPVFGLAPEELFASPQVVSTGTPQLMVPVRDHDALRKVRADDERYSALKAAEEFFSTQLFCLGGATARGDTFARHLVPGEFEDPFTGSATGCMGAYLWRHGLIDRPEFVAEQGHWMRRPGTGNVQVVGPPDAIETVRVGGAAVTVVRGELVL